MKLAQELGAILLTVEGTNHTAYLGTGSPCVDDIGNDLLHQLEAPPDGHHLPVTPASRSDIGG